MTGKTAGVVARIKELAPSCSNSHCVLHRQALLVKTTERDLNTVLDDAIKLVNYSKSRPLNARVFKLLFEEMGSQHNAAALYRHNRAVWGKVLVRVF
jgi:hypothetical protein